MKRYTIPRTAHCESGALAMTQPIEAAADRAIHGTHPGRLAAVHAALADAGHALTYAYETTQILAASPALGELVEAFLEAEKAGVTPEVLTAAADLLRVAAVRGGAHPDGQVTA